MRLTRSGPIVLVSALLILTSCSGHGSHSSSADSPTTTVTGAVPATAADIDFARGMLAHHQQAIEMADLALAARSGASAGVLDLATRIKAAQGPEIDEMKQWLVSWGQPTVMADHDGHDMGSMDGMMSDDDMKKLASATGGAFDQLWLAMMIEHHQGAVTEATKVKTSGSDPRVLALADEIVATQQREITEMQTLLGN